jgi:hypothetical protein
LLSRTRLAACCVGSACPSVCPVLCTTPGCRCAECVRGCLATLFRPELGQLEFQPCIRRCTIQGWSVTSTTGLMRVTLLSDGKVQAGREGFIAVYGTNDPLTRIRQCAISEVALAYADGSIRFCGVAMNGIGGAPMTQPRRDAPYLHRSVALHPEWPHCVST